MVDGGWNNNYYTIKNKKRPEYDPCKYYYEDSGKLIKEFGECLIRKNWV